MSYLTGLHNLVSAGQFTSSEMLEEFFALVAKVETPWLHGVDYSNSLAGKIMATLFVEDSTRTRLSFETAMLRLGGKVIVCGRQGSSMNKGESIDDTVKTIAELADVIVARTVHAGDSGYLAKASKVPFINAGDGDGEHPTQALLDAYTIWQHFGHISNLSIALVGDLKYSRTVHSLLKLLGLYEGITYHILGPDRILIDPRQYVSNAAAVRTHQKMDDLVAVGPDVIYMTRNQVERHPENNIVRYFNKHHHLDGKQANVLPEKSIILHPLPRNHEIHREVDMNPRAAYFKQVKNGLYVRMALLLQLLESWS